MDKPEFTTMTVRLVESITATMPASDVTAVPIHRMCPTPAVLHRRVLVSVRVHLLNQPR